MAQDDVLTHRRRPKVAIPEGNETPEQPRKRKRRRRRSSDPPFCVIFLQTGVVLGSLCFVLYAAYRFVVPQSAVQRTYDDDDDFIPPLHQEQVQNANNIGLERTVEPVVETAPPLPVWNLTAESAFDAYGIAERYAPTENDAFWRAAAGLRQEFAERYGGENAARAIQERGLSFFGKDEKDFPSDLKYTACRILNAKREKRPFRFAFGGYSVTVGRGNYFRQSFPFVMETLLHTVFKLLDVDLVVKNAAIGGIPSFPYGWCMENFWGHEADVVSWDYSMNEAGGDPVGLEAYIRHILQLPKRPKLIVKDTFMAIERRKLLKQYVEMDALQDPIVVHTDPAARPYLDRKEEFRPEGFQEWRQFGSPPGALGQALHHPAVKEHEFIAWLLAMHFLGSLELIAADHDGSLLQCPTEDKMGSLPSPLASEAINSTKPWKSILFGGSSENDHWHMNPIYCRTSFEPTLSGDLASIVVSGSVAETIDIMLPRSKMFYNKGWVLDLSDGEKQARRKLDLFGGLGFVDSKKAYYGIYASGTLELLLPYQSQKGDLRQPEVGNKASDWYKSVVVCEVNEKREAGACSTEKDIHYKLGGANVTGVFMMDAAGTLYLGKKLCNYITVPENARLTTRALLKQNETQPLLMPPVEEIEKHKNDVGLAVEISVNNFHIVKREQACSISHIVWEQRRSGS